MEPNLLVDNKLNIEDVIELFTFILETFWRVLIKFKWWLVSLNAPEICGFSSLGGGCPDLVGLIDKMSCQEVMEASS